MGVFNPALSICVLSIAAYAVGACNARAAKSVSSPDAPGSGMTPSKEHGQGTGRPKSRYELHRVIVENAAGGVVKGSRDGGSTWTELGKVLSPIQGEMWLPTENGNGVLAFNFLRGPSNIFGSAVNNVHIRFSDPEGFTLPADFDAPLPSPHGASFSPKEAFPKNQAEISKRVAYLDIPGGTSFFGKEWSPKVGSKVYMGDGTNFRFIPYEFGPDHTSVDRKQILIITEEEPNSIEYLEFENTAGGKIIVKRTDEEPRHIAKVLKPVQGIGRFVGSEFIEKPGVIRANHAGVIDVGTTDIKIDQQIPSQEPLSELRGGFQIVPSHHFRDRSMRAGGDHPEVYMEVGPIQDPPHLKRYDMGIDGTYPLFHDGIRAGTGLTYFRFAGEDAWYETSEAVAAEKFRRADNTPVKHLRGYIKDALHNVTGIRIVFSKE